MDQRASSPGHTQPHASPLYADTSPSALLPGLCSAVPFARPFLPRPLSICSDTFAEPAPHPCPALSAPALGVTCHYAAARALVECPAPHQPGRCLAEADGFVSGSGLSAFRTVSVNPHNQGGRYASRPRFTDEEGWSERSSHLPDMAQLPSGRVRIRSWESLRRPCIGNRLALVSLVVPGPTEHRVIKDQ